MAIITDEIVKKGYFPDGFKQKNGFRIYRYKRKFKINRKILFK